MPSKKVLAQKQAVVAELVEKIKNADGGVLVNFEGLNVQEDTTLRRKLREGKVEYTVVKNTLLRFALKEVGYENITDVLSGTTALAFSEDDGVAPARILCDFAKSNEKLKVKAGFIEGSTLDVNGVVSLSKIPSREGLLAQVLYGLNGPISKLAYCIQAIVDSKTEGEAASEQVTA